MKSNYSIIDTPALLIDQVVLMKNIREMQAVADARAVTLRPHTKTHKMPEIAEMQIAAGAKGIAVAKVGEAEVMAQHGISDIFIANQIVGLSKIRRIRDLSKRITISCGIDNHYQVDEINSVFSEEGLVADVLIEIEIGENRSGVIEFDDFENLVNYIKAKPAVHLKGIFSHDGHSYRAESVAELEAIFTEGQRRTLEFAALAKALAYELEVISVGSTPPFLYDFDLMPGITEIRIGTYALMDVAQSNILGSFEKCAASVITTVISKPTVERVITDAGAKALTAQSREGGMSTTVGKGYIKSSGGIFVDQVYDEHGIIYSKKLSDSVGVGDKIEIIPNHICPVCNLYDTAYLVAQGQVIKELDIAARGKLR